MKPEQRASGEATLKTLATVIEALTMAGKPLLAGAVFAGVEWIQGVLDAPPLALVPPAPPEAAPADAPPERPEPYVDPRQTMPP